MRDATGRYANVLVLGGGSEIASAILAELARRGGYTAVLAARDPGKLDRSGLEALGVRVDSVAFDARESVGHPALVESVAAAHGDIDLAIVASGVLGPSRETQATHGATVELMETNATGTVSLLAALADHMQFQGHGTIVLLSSVAAERARLSNFAYGASKAAADAFAVGLQLALEGSGVNVMIVRPGFVRTRMTSHLTPAPFAATAPQVAASVLVGLDNEQRIVWVPGMLRWVMRIIGLLPNAAMRRL